MKKLFECTFTEYNGEQEYSYEKLVYAKDVGEADEILLDYLEHWYEDEDVEAIERGHEFFGGAIIVCMGSVIPTTKKAFMEGQFDAALIN